MNKLEKLIKDIGRAFTTRHVAWTYLGIFQLIMLGVLIVYKYMIPQSVCMCGSNSTMEELMNNGFKEGLNIIKFRDFGDCETVCSDYGQVWNGLEVDYDEFVAMVRRFDQMNFSLDFKPSGINVD